MTQKQVREALSVLGPAVKGSLVETRKPCVRASCPACKSGEKHRVFMFHYSEGGKRRCMYVPLGLVAVLREALETGRRIEEFLHCAGPALIREHRRKSGRS